MSDEVPHYVVFSSLLLFHPFSFHTKFYTHRKLQAKIIVFHTLIFTLLAAEVLQALSKINLLLIFQ
jgi:hypothetical protein